MDRSLKTQKMACTVWDFLTRMENARRCNDQAEGRLAGLPGLATSVGVNQMKITRSFK